MSTVEPVKVVAEALPSMSFYNDLKSGINIFVCFTEKSAPFEVSIELGNMV